MTNSDSSVNPEGAGISGASPYRKLDKHESNDTRSRPLQGRVAIVTGSGRNIGRAIALHLARDGAKIVLNGHRDREALECVATEIAALGSHAEIALADVADPQAVDAMVQTAMTRYGRIDIAVSNVSQRLHQPFLEISIEDWQHVISTNLSSSFYLARACLPHMVQNGFGRIIHISGRDGFSPKPNRAHNVTAKAGVYALSKAIAIEFGPQGITANTIAPGIIDTDRDLTHYPDVVNLDGEGSFASRKRAIPVRRFGRTDEVAAACSYLCSDSGGFVTGQIFHINGGEFMF